MAEQRRKIRDLAGRDKVRPPPDKARAFQGHDQAAHTTPPIMEIGGWFNRCVIVHGGPPLARVSSVNSTILKKKGRSFALLPFFRPALESPNPAGVLRPALPYRCDALRPVLRIVVVPLAPTH